MELEDFLRQYIDCKQEIDECESRLLELEYPQRGNRIANGDHAGISNQPEEYAIIKDRLDRKIRILKAKLPRYKTQIEAFLDKLNPRKAKILRKKYIEGLNTLELAAWMRVKPKSALAALRLTVEYAKPIYEEFIASVPHKDV